MVESSLSLACEYLSFRFFQKKSFSPVGIMVETATVVAAAAQTLPSGRAAAAAAGLQQTLQMGVIVCASSEACRLDRMLVGTQRRTAAALLSSIQQLVSACCERCKWISSSSSSSSNHNHNASSQLQGYGADEDRDRRHQVHGRVHVSCSGCKGACSIVQQQQ